MPGTIVHELSHALLCLVTGTTIKELNLFTPNSTGIKYDKPKIPFLFDFIIAAAPMFGCVFSSFLYQSCFPIPFTSTIHFPRKFILPLKGFSIYCVICSMRYGLLFMPFKNQFRITEIHHIFFLLALIIFTVSMSPHKQDIKHLVLGFGIIALILFFLEKLGVHLQQYKWWNFCIKELWVITALTISVLATLLFITLVTMGLIKGYRLTFGHKSSPK